MAERRMFAKTIIDSDAFLDMPVTARLLYYDLAMRADDDGFINSPKKIMRMIGASQDDLSILTLRKFIIPFESGVVVIKHWRIHNYIRKDTYNSTPYLDEKKQLLLDENKAYTLAVNESDTGCLQPVDEPSTQVRLGKDRLGKVRLGEDIEQPAALPAPKRKNFKKPSFEDVQAYCNESGYHIDVDRFMNYYESNGWMVGRNKMKDWKATVRNWASKEKPVSNKADTKHYSDPEEFYR